MKISVIIPCYNEVKTIEKVIDKVREEKKYQKEIIVIDDFSNDGTREILKKKGKKYFNKLILHKKNFGKGAAIKSSKKFIKGNIVIIQDADLEYYPEDYKKLIQPIKNKYSNVVYGSRVLNKSRYYKNNFSSNFRVFANQILTIFSNLINKQNLTDAHTCYKVFRSVLFKKITLKENDFSFCPEVTTKISKMRENIIEVPIRYKGRSYDKGKKISFKDGILALKTLIKYRYFS